MHERVWYRSLYWRIAVGYIALLAVLLVVQTGLAVWLTDRMWGRSSRTPGELAEIVAQDVSERLVQSPGLDLDKHLRDRYGSGYQPFVVVLTGDDRTLSNRPSGSSEKSLAATCVLETSAKRCCPGPPMTTRTSAVVAS